MRRREFIFAGIAAGSLGGAARAQEIKELRAISGDRFIDGDQEYLLADIIAPSAFKLSDGAATYFRQSESALNRLLSGAVIEPENAGPATRWGGRVVYARRRGEQKTLQEGLVAAGAVRVEPQTDNLEFIAQLLALEQIARNERRGLWALRDYRVIDAADATPAIGAFHLIEGIVTGAEKVKSRFYLNFGSDYLTDFTAGARGALYRKWSKSGLDLATLKDAPIRVRGFVANINGPSIDLTHVKQVEILD